MTENPEIESPEEALKREFDKAKEMGKERRIFYALFGLLIWCFGDFYTRS